MAVTARAIARLDGVLPTSESALAAKLSAGLGAAVTDDPFCRDPS